MRSLALSIAMFGANYLGLVLLALGQKRHWHVFTGARALTAGITRRLRMAAATLLLGSLLLALIADGTGFGTLLWVYGFSVSAFAVVATLALRAK